MKEMLLAFINKKERKVCEDSLILLILRSTILVDIAYMLKIMQTKTY